MRKGKDPDAVGMEKGNVTSIWKETLSLLFLLGTKVNVEGRWELSEEVVLVRKDALQLTLYLAHSPQSVLVFLVAMKYTNGSGAWMSLRNGLPGWAAV